MSSDGEKLSWQMGTIRTLLYSTEIRPKRQNIKAFCNCFTGKQLMVHNAVCNVSH